jgi:hypothetical protein
MCVEHVIKPWPGPLTSADPRTLISDLLGHPGFKAFLPRDSPSCGCCPVLPGSRPSEEEGTVPGGQQ